jgi:CRISPR-associated exonuclease Cas4
VTSGSAEEWADEDDLEVPISALEHFSYCPRQCALIHVEQTFEENLFTVRGQLAHERVDSAEGGLRAGVHVVRSMPLWSERLHLRGKADIVEFRPQGPFPVEYKLGRLVRSHAALQLCAQALCLEEMLGVSVPEGALFSHATRRRTNVSFDEELRSATQTATVKIRSLLLNQQLPEPPNDARCPNCSLLDACLPNVIASTDRLRGLQGALFRSVGAVDDP